MDYNKGGDVPIGIFDDFSANGNSNADASQNFTGGGSLFDDMDDVSNIKIDLPDELTNLGSPNNGESNAHNIEGVSDYLQNPDEKRQSEEDLTTLGNEKGAEFMAFLIDTGYARILARVDGTGDYEKYLLKEQDSKMFRQALEKWMQARDFKMTPEYALLLVMAVIFPPKYIEARQFRKQMDEAKAKASRRKERKQSKKEQQDIPSASVNPLYDDEEVDDVEEREYVDYTDTREVAERRQYFQVINKKQYYYRFRPQERTYVKAEERSEVGKASPKIRLLIDQGLNNEEILRRIYQGN